MALINPNIGVAGSDGVVPVYDPDGRWSIWAYQEIWLGRTGKNKYVPKINDYVYNYETHERFVVVSLDDRLVPNLRKIRETDIRNMSDVDALLRSNRRTSPDSYRVLLDTSVIPYRLKVDSRFEVGGTENKYAQIFRGTNIASDGEIISHVYDQHGELLSTMIPLELVIQAGMNNHSKKCVPPCYTMAKMPDDELVTVVIYNDQGVVNSVQEFYVYNTAFVTKTDNSQKYVKDISLESIFMSESDPTLLAYPLNVPVRGLNLFGVVHYSDGSTKRLPVDGRKFAVHGLRDYLSTIPGYENKITLKYVLSDDETAVAMPPIKPGSRANYEISPATGEKFFTKNYKVVVVEPDGAYSVKLYAYPEWVDNNTGYRLKWWLFNLERSTWREVTSLVRYNGGTSFRGKEYGTNQRLSVGINLKQVNNTYKDYQHAQVIDITLQRNATDKTNYRWSVGFEISQVDQYGIDNWAKITPVNANLNRLDITQGLTDTGLWLDRIWKATKPIYDENQEAYAPRPDHFIVKVGDRETTYPLEAWHNPIELNYPVRPTDNVYLIFVKRLNDTDLFLGISGLPVFVI